MSSLFKRIKSINQWEKDLVIGYNNDAQQLVHPKQIPLAISYLCLVYHHEYDLFHEIGPAVGLPSDIKINDKGDEFMYPTSDYMTGCSTVFGLMDIYKEKQKPGYIYSWKFLITNTKSASAIYDWISIGISDSTDCADNDFSIDPTSKHSFYAYLSFQEKVAKGEDEESYGDRFYINDIVEMVVDTSKNHIKFSVNDKDHGIAYKGIDFESTKYKMAVYNGDKEVNIKLTDVQIELCRN